MINIFTKHKNISYFDTINEYINYLEETKPYDSNRMKSSHTGKYNFTGTHSFDEALDLCKYGDTELADYVYNQTLKINNLEGMYKTKLSYKNDVVGFIPNVSNYLMGVPNNMIRDDRTMLKSKIINVFINLSAHCGVEADEIKENASKCVMAINYLEKQGYRCNVYVGDNGTKYEDYYSVVIKVKGDREPLNITKMAFPMCHPSMLRRLGFKWIETIPIDFTNSGYGRPYDDINGVKGLISEVLGDIPITILNISHDYGQVDNIVDLLKKRGLVK